MSPSNGHETDTLATRTIPCMCIASVTLLSACVMLFCARTCTPRSMPPVCVLCAHASSAFLLFSCGVTVTSVYT